VLAGSLAAALARFGWPFELFAHFRWQLAAATIALVPLALLARRRRWWLVIAAAAALQLLPFRGWPQPAPGPAPAVACRGAEFSVVTLNLWYRNRDPRVALEWLRDHPADVVLLQEVTAAWQDALGTALPEYPHRFFIARADPYGIGMLSRTPLERIRPADFAGDGRPSVVAVVEAGGRSLQAVNLHTRWPILPGLQELRDRGLRAAALDVRREPLPTVLGGDLNLTPYAPAFALLTEESGLRDALAARWWRPTWQAGFWPLALPIDHVLVPDAVCVVGTLIGPDVGSDHRPVHVTLRWR
jgi:endonuclease/exonuclease/phosphatase (EEP) superfamily protein YafD